MLRLLNSGADKNTVAEQFDRWVYDNGVKVKGLINRRNAEKKLFLS
jgi:lysozyme